MVGNNQESADQSAQEDTQAGGFISSRRRFLTGVVATGAAIGVGGVAMAQQGGGKTIKLGGKVPGWQGQSPSSIQGETNPTLEFVAGEKITVTWTNLDGAPHNFQVLDSDDNVLHKTETMSDKGESQTTSFTATTEMVKYDCVVHPTSMVGDVNVSEAESSTPTQTATQTATATQTQTSTATQAETTTATQTTTETQTTAEETTESEQSNGKAKQNEEATTEETTQSQQGNGKAKQSEETTQETTQSQQGNGKAKQGGNGKAKMGDGTDQSESGSQSDSESGSESENQSESGTESNVPLIVTHDTVVSAQTVTENQAPCALNSQFLHGQRVIFRIDVINPDTGEEMDDSALEGVSVRIKNGDGQTVDAYYGNHPPENPTDMYWVAPWTVPEEFPAGPVKYQIVVDADRDAKSYRLEVPPAHLTVLEGTYKPKSSQ